MSHSIKFATSWWFCLLAGVARRMMASASVALVLMSFGPLSADEAQKTKQLLAWGQKGDKPGEFYSPIGIAISRKDQVFVTDLNNAACRSLPPTERISMDSIFR